jgi:hypothetical protein
LKRRTINLKGEKLCIDSKIAEKTITLKMDFIIVLIYKHILAKLVLHSEQVQHRITEELNCRGKAMEDAQGSFNHENEIRVLNINMGNVET